MRFDSSPAIVLGAALSATLVLASPALGGGEPRDILDWDELIARLGPDAPTGAGVLVGITEGVIDGDYGPNLGNPELDGKTVTVVSPAPPGQSGHATTVFRNAAGLDTSVAPGVTDLYLWEAVDWLNNEIKGGAPGTVAPELLPADIRFMNHSWVANAPTPLENDVLRRADFLAQRDGLMLVVGMANDNTTNPALLSHMFNGISVGLRDGTHAAFATSSDIDVPGRQKPEIVAPSDFTSFATPQIVAIGAVLVETARTEPELMSNPSAEAHQTIKATILASAVHENLADGTWANGAVESGPDRGTSVMPLDDRVGVGTANIDRAHRILTGGEFDGTADHTTAPTASPRGWDFGTLTPNGDARFWQFDLFDGADEFSVALTWNRNVRLTSGTWYVPDLELTLWRLGEDGGLESLVGDAGLSFFAGGNVTSESPVDNVEHLYVTGLAPGSYVLEATRLDTGSPIPPVDWPFAIAWFGPEPSFSFADINQDGAVDFTDLLLVISDWGACAGCPADLDFDGDVDLLDLLVVLANWS